MAYNSISNHNRFPLSVAVNWGDYWDFQLADRPVSSAFSGGLSEECLISYIDTSDDSCVDDGNLLSKDGYVWSEAVNNGIKLEHIGSTGVDNGLFIFDKNTVTKEEFENIFNHSVLETEKDDFKLHLNSVGGNNGLYYYGSEITDIEGIRAARLNGGFYQGFFRTGDGCDYNILPSSIDTSWDFEVTLRRKDFENESGLPRMFDKSPENKGVFLYIGTRAENKWWIDYNKDGGGMEGDDTVKERIREIVTDNKYLIFDRTKDGLTVHDVKENEDITAVIEMPIRKESEENPFLVYNRTKTGKLACDEIAKKVVTKKYDVNADLYRNAMAFIVRDDGSVGYRYITKDCNNGGYKVDSEFSYPGMVAYDEWAVIHIRIDAAPTYAAKSYNDNGSSVLRIRIYVNGKLVFVSREMPMLSLRNLDDLQERQEGVAFNISLGGGTQGLGDVIYGDYIKTPEYVLPLEKEFGGSFSGYIKSFRFYNCGMTFDRILANSRYELFSLRK